MKQNKIFLLAATVLTLASCADDNFQDFRTAAPERGAAYEYLNSYSDLKTYVDRAASPIFKLGGATSANEFNKQELVYALDVANFDELVTGNDFKYSSCVDDNGQMNFATVTNFVHNAKDAGLDLYGHTLVWHAQQRPTYLNGLIAGKKIEVDPNAGPVHTEMLVNGDCEGTDVSCLVGKDGDGGGGFQTHIVDGAGVDGSRCVKVHAIDNPSQDWDTQFFITTPGHVWQAGEQYHFAMKVRADKPAGTGIQAHGAPGAYIHWQMFNSGFNFTTEWQSLEWDGVISAEQAGSNGMQTVAFNLNVLKEENNYYFDDMSWELVSEPQGSVSLWENQVANGDCEGDDVTCLVGRDGGGGGDHTTIVNGAGVDGSRAVRVHSIASAAQDWDTQFFVYTPNKVWKEGEKFQFKMMARADKGANVSVQSHTTPGAYIFWSFLAGNYSIGTDWTAIDYEGTVSGDQAGANGMQTIAFNLNVLREDNNYYFDNVEWNIEVEADRIPLTEEEKRDTLTWALENWIKGMMEACEGNVKAWDLVNEPMSDAAPTELKTAAREGGDDNFYWQDYLGKDYVRTAARLARQYGGNDLKLFINDYNLEAAYNHNAKCDGLIDMIKYWESDGVTKIDGIGSQMHVTYQMNPDAQKRNEEAVVNMLKKLAATGKLVRISELDMGIADKDGNTIKTVDVTEEQHKLMAGYYTFIVKKYFEIIPAAQRYGICVWGVTDSPDAENSYWRRGEPIGLWDVNYYRKHTYAGFADGLSGK